MNYLIFHKNENHYNQYFYGFEQVLFGIADAFSVMPDCLSKAQLTNINEENGRENASYLS